MSGRCRSWSSTTRRPSPTGSGCPPAIRRRCPPPPSSDEDPRWIYYSSGTTAAPKGVRHCDRSVIAGSAGVVGIVGASSSDVNPIAFPVSHIGGAAMLAASLRTGMRLVLFDAFDPAETPVAIAAHRPTLLGSATPFFVAFMAAQRAHGVEPLFPDLRGCVGGGAPITAELGRQLRETLSVNGAANSWGLTEFPVATSQTPDGAPDLLDRTVGRPVPGVSVRVVDETERVVGVGEEGELRLKGPQCFLGYVDASLDADAFDDDGWFRTGDRGPHRRRRQRHRHRAHQGRDHPQCREHLGAGDRGRAGHATRRSPTSRSSACRIRGPGSGCAPSSSRSPAAT